MPDDDSQFEPVIRCVYNVYSFKFSMQTTVQVITFQPSLICCCFKCKYKCSSKHRFFYRYRLSLPECYSSSPVLWSCVHFLIYWCTKWYLILNCLYETYCSMPSQTLLMHIKLYQREKWCRKMHKVLEWFIEVTQVQEILVMSGWVEDSLV
jgi:hypothetical protein